MLLTQRGLRAGQEGLARYHGAGTCSTLAVAHVDVRERDTGGDLEVRLRIRVDRLLHEVYPDRKRRTRATHAVRVPAVETHPHQRQQSRRVADEPRVAAVVGGAGLARDDLGEPARMHGATRARFHDALEKGGDQPGLGRRNDLHRFLRSEWHDHDVAEQDGTNRRHGGASYSAVWPGQVRSSML